MCIRDSRITVHFAASGELAQAIDEHRDYLMHETLCVTLSNELDADADAGTQTEIDGHSLGFTLRRQGE